jgi:hypothetical protein
MLRIYFQESAAIVASVFGHFGIIISAYEGKANKMFNYNVLDIGMLIAKSVEFLFV